MSTPARRRSSKPAPTSTASSITTSTGTASVRRVPTPSNARVGGVRLADAVALFLATITVANTRRGYAAPLRRLVADFGPDVDVGGLDPDRVAGWFTFAWGGCTAKTFNTRLTALGSACRYWRAQEWLVGDPLMRLRARPVATDRSKALTTAQIAALLGLETAGLRERVLWHLLYESTARAEEVLRLDVADLQTLERRAVVTRKGGARDVIVWQTGTARLLPRLLAGRRGGPVFLTDRRALPAVALVDLDPGSGRARLSYRRAAELFEQHTAALQGGPYTLHQLRHSYATRLLRKGTPIEVVSTLLGHSSIATTLDIYGNSRELHRMGEKSQVA